jgi:hypothetical protein
VYALLANGQNASVNSFLESNGDGYLKTISTDAPSYQEIHSVVAIALEAVDMSGSSGVDPSGRIRIMII